MDVTSISKYKARALVPEKPTSPPDGTVRYFSPISYQPETISFCATMEFAFLLDDIGHEELGKKLPELIKARKVLEYKWRVLEKVSCADSGAPIVRITLFLEKPSLFHKPFKR